MKQEVIDRIFDQNKTHCPTCESPVTTKRTVEYIGNPQRTGKPGWYHIVHQKCTNPKCFFEMRAIQQEATQEEIPQ